MSVLFVLEHRGAAWRRFRTYDSQAKAKADCLRLKQAASDREWRIVRIDTDAFVLEVLEC